MRKKKRMATKKAPMKTSALSVRAQVVLPSMRSAAFLISFPCDASILYVLFASPERSCFVWGRYDDSGSTDEDIESWFNDIDTNKDQHIDFDEYATYFKSEKIDGVSVRTAFFDSKFFQ
jgi:hypothetical protein